MNRRQIKNRKKQEKKVRNIIEKFLKGYNIKVEAVTIPARGKVLKVVKANVSDTHKRVNRIRENKEADLSSVNAFHLDVWRGLLAHFKGYYPLVRVNPNYFDGFIMWDDRKPDKIVHEPFLSAV